MTIIVATDLNFAIGKENTIPWRQREDMRRFKELTTDNTVIMGSKTFDSIGKPLPNRHNVVLSRSRSHVDGCQVYSDPMLAFEEHPKSFIIGGGEIYGFFLIFADRIEHTIVHTMIEGADTWFLEMGELDMEEWEVVSKTDHLSDGNNQYPYTFVSYQRKN